MNRRLSKIARGPGIKVNISSVSVKPSIRRPAHIFHNQALDNYWREKMDNKYLVDLGMRSRFPQHVQSPSHYNTFPNFVQGPQTLPRQQQEDRGYFHSLPPQNVRRTPQRQSSLNPPFPTTDITLATPSPPTVVSAGFQPSYQARHQDQISDLQKLQPPAERIGVTVESVRTGPYTYPLRTDPKPHYGTDNFANKGQGHSLDRFVYRQKPGAFGSQHQTAGITHVQQEDYLNSLPRNRGISHSQPPAARFPTSTAESLAATTYTKHDQGAFPPPLLQQQNGGGFYKSSTDSHINAPNVQTNAANLRGEQHSTQSLPGFQSYTLQQIPSSSRLGGHHQSPAGGGIRTPVSGGSGNFSAQRGYTQPTQTWNSANGGRIGSPVSVKVGSQRGSVSADSDAGQSSGNFPRALSPSTTGSEQHTPVIHNFSHPNVYAATGNTSVTSPVPDVSQTDVVPVPALQSTPLRDTQRVAPFSEFPSQKPTTTPGFDNWALGNFQHNMMANPGDQLKAMEENMKRMQKHMEEQFKNFNMNNPPSMAIPEGFPPMLEPMKILPPPSAGITGISEPLVPGVPTPVPNFTSQPTNYSDSSRSDFTPVGYSTPSSTLTSRSSNMAPLPAGSLHPGMDTMELNRCIQDTPDGKKQLQLRFDMQDFKPEEVSVKKDKNKLEVHAHHEEKEPNRVACKVFHQQYHLPKNVRLAKMEYAMDPEGTLTVRSPVKPRHNVKFEEGQKLEQTKLIHPQQ